MPSNSYAVRISHPAEIVKRICSIWAMRCKRLACYQHDDDGATNIHCHIIIEEADIEKKQLRNLAKPIADVHGNAMMSFRSEYDGDLKGFSYMTKGKYEPVYLLGWTQEEHSKWKAAWVPPTEYVKQTYWRKLYDKFTAEVKDLENPTYQQQMKQWLNNGDSTFPQQYDKEHLNRKIAGWVLKQHQGLWSPKAAKDFQFLRDQVFIDKGLGFPTRHFQH